MIQSMLVAFIAALTPVTASDTIGLRVVTFNIRYGSAADGENAWPRRRSLVLETITRHSPDVLGLQEALDFQLDQIREALPAFGHIGVGRNDGRRAGEHAAILYRTDRLAVAESGTFWLSDTPDRPGSRSWGNRITRICTWARFVDATTGQGFYVFNVHLDHESQPSRERSVELLLERIADRQFADPVIVLGDFNAGESNPAMTRLRAGHPSEGRGFRDTFRTIHPDARDVGTFHAFRGSPTSDEKIDGVFVSPEWDVVAATIDRWPGVAPYPSDHFPVTAILRLTR